MSDSENHSNRTDKEKKKEKVSSIQGSKKVSPYDMNNNDNLGNMINQIQLRGKNYVEWE